MSEPETDRGGGQKHVTEAPGWYPDPYFLGRERYWDGRVWTEECRVSATKESQPSAAPRPPKDPETVTPSATAARAAAKAGGAAGATATATATKAPPRPDPKTDGAKPTTKEPTAPPKTAAAAAAAATAATVATAKTARPTKDAATVTAQQSAVRTPTPTPDTESANGRPPGFVAPPPPAATGAAAGAPTTTTPASEPPTQPVEIKPDKGDKPDKPDKPEEPKTEQVTLGPEPKKAKAPRTAKKDVDPAARRRRRILLGGIAAVVVVLAVIAVVVLVRHNSGGSSNTNDVAKAAQATLHQHTATVTFVVKPAGGQNPSGTAASGLNGNGNFDFRDSTGSATLFVTGSSTGGSEQLIVQKDQTLLLNPGSLVGQLVPGKSWIALTTDDLASSATPTGFAVGPTVYQEMVGNPKLWLKELRATGVTFTSFGESTFQGTPVHGYAVTLPQKAIDHRLSALPSSMRSAASGVHATEDVYVATNGLVKAIVVPVTVHSGSSTSTEDVTITFSGWGNPVHIATPTLNEIVSWAQFKAVLTFATKLG